MRSVISVRGTASAVLIPGWAEDTVAAICVRSLEQHHGLPVEVLGQDRVDDQADST